MEDVFLAAGFLAAGFLGAAFLAAGFGVFFAVVLDFFLVADDDFFMRMDPPTEVPGEYEADDMLANVVTGFPASNVALFVVPNMGPPLGTPAGTLPPSASFGILPPVRMVLP